jgi:hypothetical protein
VTMPNLTMECVHARCGEACAHRCDGTRVDTGSWCEWAEGLTRPFLALVGTGVGQPLHPGLSDLGRMMLGSVRSITQKERPSDAQDSDI